MPKDTKVMQETCITKSGVFTSATISWFNFAVCAVFFRVKSSVRFHRECESLEVASTLKLCHHQWCEELSFDWHCWKKAKNLNDFTIVARGRGGGSIYHFNSVSPFCGSKNLQNVWCVLRGHTVYFHWQTKMQRCPEWLYNDNNRQRSAVSRQRRTRW